MSSNKQVIAKLIKQLVLNAGNHRWAEVEELQLTPDGSTIDETIVPLNDTINELWSALGFKEEAPLMTKPDEEEEEEYECDCGNQHEVGKTCDDYEWYDCDCGHKHMEGNDCPIDEEKDEEVYAVVEGVDDLIPDDNNFAQFKTRTDENGNFRKTTYYRTYGGGPEGGYFLRTVTFKNGENRRIVYSVERNWGTPFKYECLLGKTLRFKKGDEMAGTPDQVCVY